MAKTTRKIGLGVMGWADMLIKLGIRYDSDEALKLAQKLQNLFRILPATNRLSWAKNAVLFPAFGDSVWKKKGLKLCAIQPLTLWLRPGQFL